MADHAVTTPDTPRPVAGRDRLLSMDALRGFALLGILGPNILAFAWPWSAIASAQGMADAALIADPETPVLFDRANEISLWLIEVLFQGKFMFLFASLFGAGVVFFSRKFDAGGASRLSRGAGLWYTRMGVLLAIGFVHAFGLWFGDILVWYAFAGLAAVWWVRRWSPRTLFITGSLAYLFGTIVMLAITALSDWAIQQGHMTEDQMGGVPLADDIAAYANGTYLDQFVMRLMVLLPWYVIMPFTFLWQITGLMMVGIGLTRTGVFTGARSNHFYATLAAFGITIGLILTVVVRSWLRGLDSPIASFYWMTVAQLVGSPLALGYVGVVVLVAKSRALEFIAIPLAAVGRMALTNYLLQTLICTTIFYSYGGGLYATVQFPFLWAVVLSVWIVNIVFSMLWLSAFRFGPAEWAWRSLTYLRPQPLLKDAMLKTRGS
ncbi:MAG: DUF418 domain-containing protein [Phycisphaerales bacterium]